MSSNGHRSHTNAQTQDTAGPSTPPKQAHVARPPNPLQPLQTVCHSHFLDLSETEGVRTPRPTTLTPSPPMRSTALPPLSDDDAGPSLSRLNGGRGSKAMNGKRRLKGGTGGEGLPISVDEAVNGPYEGILEFSTGAPGLEGGRSEGGGVMNGEGKSMKMSSPHTEGKQHLGGGLFGYGSAPSAKGADGNGRSLSTDEAGMDEGQQRAISRTKSTRSVLGRGRGRVEPEEEGEAARLLRTIDFAAREVLLDLSYWRAVWDDYTNTYIAWGHAEGLMGQKHTCQRRKDLDQTPYINHPIAVANFLSSTGITDVCVMQAAVLHDTVEDTHTTIEEIAQHFGPTVARIVEECTDDQSLSGQARKAAQIRTAGGKSRAAQQVKLADKLHNLESIRRCPPVGWTARRVQNYFVWAKQVTDICAPSHPPLAERLQKLYETAYTEIDGSYFPCHPDFCGPLTEEEKSRIDKRLQCLKKGEKPSPLPIFF